VGDVVVEKEGNGDGEESAAVIKVGRPNVFRSGVGARTEFRNDDALLHADSG